MSAKCRRSAKAAAEATCAEHNDERPRAARARGLPRPKPDSDDRVHIRIVGAGRLTEVRLASSSRQGESVDPT